MRITNTMMINSSLANIATNKNQMSILDTQLSTKKKISRPSEDPIIAIRALRLRSSVNEVTEYLEKNIPDASSWLKITQGAIEESETITQKLEQYCIQGSTDTYSTEERSTIASSMQDLKDTYYKQGNVDDAGRYVFTGFRTDSSLTFMTDADADNYSYDITQSFDAADFDTKYVYENSIDITDLEGYIAGTKTAGEVNREEVYRLTLAYNKCSDEIPDVSYKAADGSTVNITPVLTHDANAIPGDDEMLYNPDTGELLMGKNVYSTIKNQKDLTVAYTKTDFDKGDLKPEHYFYCVRTDQKEKAADEAEGKTYTPVEYNKSLKDADPPYGYVDQSVEYIVNFQQKMRINSTAAQCFDPYFGRDVDNLSNSVATVMDLEDAQARLKEMKASALYADDASQAKIEALQAALDKEYALAHDSMQKVCETGITQMQDYLGASSKEGSVVGNRISSLELTTTRLTTQQTNLKSLRSKNEDVEIEDIAINYTSAELVYNASLTAASKVVRQSLLDFL